MKQNKKASMTPNCQVLTRSFKFSKGPSPDPGMKPHRNLHGLDVPAERVNLNVKMRLIYFPLLRVYAKK